MPELHEFSEVVSKFFRDAKGTVAVEYGIIATAMFLAIIPGFLYVSSGILVKFQDIAAFLAAFT